MVLPFTLLKMWPKLVWLNARQQLGQPTEIYSHQNAHQPALEISTGITLPKDVLIHAQRGLLQIIRHGVACQSAHGGITDKPTITPANEHAPQDTLRSIGHDYAALIVCRNGTGTLITQQLSACATAHRYLTCSPTTWPGTATISAREACSLIITLANVSLLPAARIIR